MRTLTYSVPVHGNTFFAEYPGRTRDVDGQAWTQVVGYRKGWGTMYGLQARQDNYFHTTFALPLGLPLYNPFTSDPQDLADSGTILQSIRLYFVTSGASQIFHVSAFDGGSRISPMHERRPSLGLRSGQELRFDRHAVLVGLGLSVGVSGDGEGTITFHGAVATIQTEFVEDSDPRP